MARCSTCRYCGEALKTATNEQSPASSPNTQQEVVPQSSLGSVTSEKSLTAVGKAEQDVVASEACAAASTHELKTWPVYFEEIWHGRKLFEYRKDDRGFKVKDTLCLREWCPDSKKYSGRWITAKVTYILQIPDSFVIMSLDPCMGGSASTPAPSTTRLDETPQEDKS